jgi:cobalt/nickel transport system permease protein
VSGSHGAGGFYRPGDTAVHRLAPEVKVAGSVLLTLAIVLTPRTAVPAFALYLGLLAAVAALARVGPWWLARHAVIELPFVLLALVLPFTAPGPDTRVLGVALSVEGLWQGWNIVAKGTLGVVVSLLLAATTTPRDLILGLARLRCPDVLVQIAAFMLRYLQVLTDEARRMRIARLSRGYDPRFIWQVRALAAGIGALFLRAYERGERVYVAMLARGYTGRMPAVGGPPVARAAEWTLGLAVPAAAGVVALAAVL